ncbi:MAG: hypothetical protein AB1916_01770 [Thermodesulfobacteriota bacterium]
MQTKRVLRRTAYLVLAALQLFVWSCAATQPLPQPRRVADPSAVSGAVRTADFDLAAVGYVYPGQGLNYASSGLYPVYLVFKNHGGTSPRVDPNEIRGVGADGEYLAYTLEESTRLVFASESFKTDAANAARTGTLGAVLGAGLGALLGAIGGGDNIWKGAVVGGAAGAMAGATYGAVESDMKLKSIVRDELRTYMWTDELVPLNYTKVGYIYLPAGKGVTQLKIVVRSGEKLESFTIPVSDPEPVKK